MGKGGAASSPLSRAGLAHALDLRWPLTQRVLGYATVLPVLVPLALLVALPILYSFWLGFFHQHAFLRDRTFVFLDNYVRTAREAEFWRSVELGLVYTFSTIALQLLLGVLAALLLHRQFRGRAIVRGIVLFPYMVPMIAAVVLWKWLLNDQYGFVNYALVAAGLAREPVVWFTPRTIMTSLIAVSVWAFFPFVVISVLARLQTISPDLYEAAKVDGASRWGCFLHVTLPEIRAVLFIVILLRGIWMFTKFDIVWMWAGDYGGLGENVRTLPIYAYMKTFGQYQAGLGAAVANLMFLALLIMIFVYVRAFRYEGA
jgi:multiple sugar transport system permease protein